MIMKHVWRRNEKMMKKCKMMIAALGCAMMLINTTVLAKEAADLSAKDDVVQENSTLIRSYGIHLLSESDHGVFTCAIGRQSVDRANPGDRVRITAVPDKDYYVWGMIVKDSADNIVAKNESEFTMPASDVSVTVIFAEQVRKLHAIKLRLEHEVETQITDEAGNEVKEARAGDRIYVTIPDAKYEVDKLYVQDEVYHPVAVEQLGENAYVFTMPDAPVTVNVDASIPYYGLNLESYGPGQAKLVICGREYTRRVEVSYGTVVKVCAFPDSDSAVCRLSVADDYGNEIALNEFNEFEMPKTHVTVKAVFE